MLIPKHAICLFERFLFLKNTTETAPKNNIMIKNPIQQDTTKGLSSQKKKLLISWLFTNYKPVMKIANAQTN